jgi:hypothetical protein
MTAIIQPRAQALVDTIRERIAEAARVSGLAARHEAIFDIVPALKAQIDASLAGDTLAAGQALQSLREAFEAFKRDHAIARLPYSPQIDARYPYRDELANPVHIVALRSKQGTTDATADSRLAAVQPYIDPALPDRVRAEAYANAMHCRTISPADLRDAREHALIGERGAFAVRAIRAGECLGVYGGRLMSAAMFFSCVEESFVLSANSGDSVAFIDGENILAMANTSLAYDAEGVPVAQADDDGYNMEAQTFDASSRCGRHFSIRAFFARRDIGPGAELRWNYRYSPEIVEHVFGGARRQVQRVRASELYSG